jgi:type VI secretion system protein ImpK
MNERFSLLVDPIFRYVLETQRRIEGHGAQPGLDEVHDELIRLIKKARRSAASYDRPRHYTELAEYALVYWADEVLINSAWVHAENWRSTRLLEWELYQEAVAGDKFFTKAETARMQSRDALETFFLCVAMGFQGRFAVSKKPLPRWLGAGSVHPGLREWSKDAYRHVRENLTRLMPRDDARTDGETMVLPGRRLLLRVSVLTAITVLSTLCVWIFVNTY